MMSDMINVRSHSNSTVSRPEEGSTGVQQPSTGQQGTDTISTAASEVSLPQGSMDIHPQHLNGKPQISQSQVTLPRLGSDSLSMASGDYTYLNDAHQDGSSGTNSLRGSGDYTYLNDADRDGGSGTNPLRGSGDYTSMNGAPRDGSGNGLAVNVVQSPRLPIPATADETTALNAPPSSSDKGLYALSSTTLRAEMGHRPRLLPWQSRQYKAADNALQKFTKHLDKAALSADPAQRRQQVADMRSQLGKATKAADSYIARFTKTPDLAEKKEAQLQAMTTMRSQAQGMLDALERLDPGTMPKSAATLA